VKTAGPGNRRGAVAAALVVGAVGNQFGKGSGKDAMSILASSRRVPATRWKKEVRATRATSDVRLDNGS